MKTNELSQQEMQSTNGGACVAMTPPPPSEQAYQQPDDGTYNPGSQTSDVDSAPSQDSYDDGGPAPHYIR